MKKILSLCLVLTLSLLCLCSCESDKPRVAIEVENYGTIVVELDRKAAPKTVKNFLKLVDEGFYDGLTFHRIIPGFMIQGGDPKGDGTGSSDKNVEGEFALNGWANPISHTRGVISMARGGGYNTGSCQFFICHENCMSLDGKYAAFGQVIKGMDVVDAIADYISDNPDVLHDNNGGVSPKYQPVIKSIKRV